MTPLLSACIIVRDEAHNLPGLFASVGDLVDEWVIVDTGSTDDTVAIALSRGARVLYFPWIDDFAAARNHGLEQATGQFILVLDADDRLDAPGLRAFLNADPPADVFAIEVRCPHPGGEEVLSSPRVFRRAAGVRYQQPVHEQPILDGQRLGFAPARILHEGYRAADAMVQKARRNLAILAQLPADDPHRLFQEARSHAAVANWAGAQAAILRLASDSAPLAPELIVILSRAALASRDPVAAARVVVDGLADWPDHPDLWHALFHAAGGAYLQTAAAARRAPSWQGPPTSSLHFFDDTAESLARLGLVALHRAPQD